MTSARFLRGTFVVFAAALALLCGLSVATSPLEPAPPPSSSTAPPIGTTTVEATPRETTPADARARRLQTTSPPPPRSPPPPPRLPMQYDANGCMCSNTCIYANDRLCDDGGSMGGQGNTDYCQFATDCIDCGSRCFPPPRPPHSPRPSPPPPSPPPTPPPSPPPPSPRG